MNFILVSFGIFAFSAIILVLFLKRKAKELATLEPGQLPHTAIVAKVKDKVEKYNVFQKFILIKFIEKSLLSLRVLIQKFENKTIHWLEHLRVNYKQQTPNPVFSPDYWDKVKQAAQKKERWHSNKNKSESAKIVETSPGIVKEPSIVEKETVSKENNITQVSISTNENTEPLVVSTAAPIAETKPQVAHVQTASKKRKAKKSKVAGETVENSQTTSI